MREPRDDQRDDDGTESHSAQGVAGASETARRCHVRLRHDGPFARWVLHRFKQLYGKGGRNQLKEARAQELDALEIERAIATLTIEHQRSGQERVSNELVKKVLSVGLARVRCVWQRHDLETTPKRVNALEAKRGTAV